MRLRHFKKLKRFGAAPRCVCMTISYSECSVSFHGDVPIFLGVQVEASDADAAYLSLGELHASVAALQAEHVELLRISDLVFAWDGPDIS